MNTGFSPDFGTGSGRGMRTKPGSGEIPGSLVGLISIYDSIPQNDKNYLIFLTFDFKLLELFQGSVLDSNFNFFRNNTTKRRANLYKTRFREHINHTFAMYRMDPEYDDLLRACGDEPAGGVEPDEHLLDVDDEEEILILEPPLAPTPADAPDPLGTHAAAMTAEKVNALVAEFENDDMNVSVNSGETYGTANTKGTNFTYSKYGIRENTTEVTIDYDPERPQMKSAYYQCKMARAASLGNDSTSVDFDTNGGKAKPVQFNSISSLDCIGDTEVLRTFCGTRMSSNNITVNQNISLSYDPATMKCIVCESGHNILNKGQGDSPPILVFCDQNFVPTLCGKQSCIAIARLEDCSLTELTDLAIEVLERQSIPVGSILLLGTASHLYKAGTTVFTSDWCESVKKLNEKLRNVKVLPLVPILREDAPGTLGKQLIEYYAWLKTVYDKNTLGLLPVWEKLTLLFAKTDEDGLDLGFTDFYTVALPSSLEPGSKLVPTKFHTSSSHTTTRGFDSEATNELLRTLVDHLQSNFATVANSDDLFPREPALDDQGGKEFTHCIVGGGSNMKKICPLLTAKGIQVTDLTKSGWTPTEANITALADSIRKLPPDFNQPVILDVLGNVTYRYQQLDGTMAMPYKAGGKFHLEGKVCVCGNSTLQELIKKLKPIFDAISEIGGFLLFLSPMPRYLFNGCCADVEHCVGVDTSEYVHALLHDTLALRGICKNALLRMNIERFWVPDLVGKLLPACNGIPEIAIGYKEISAADGVHFTNTGYEKITDSILECSKNLLVKSVASSVPSLSAPVNPGKQRSYYWRGFLSPVGSERPKKPQAAYLQSHPSGGGKWRGYPVNVGRGRGLPPGRPPYYRRN